mmetsp:Transcript_38163/g.79955  ORF Transcript_38163/g.79955 Transcript_38163/m.79955 type:complete len:190 (-) Transcript_38163:417-986(-)
MLLNQLSSKELFIRNTNPSLGLSDICSNTKMSNDGCNELLPGIFSCNKVNSFCMGTDTSSIFTLSTKFRDSPFSLEQETSCEKLGQPIQSIHDLEWKNVNAKSKTHPSKSLRTTSLTDPMKPSLDIEQESSSIPSSYQLHEFEPCKAIISAQCTATAEGRSAWQAELERAVMLLDAFCIVDRGFIPEDD